HALDRDEAGRAPPQAAAMAKRVFGQARDVEAFGRRAHDSSSSSPGLGQNQPIRVTASGRAPTGTAQGVKIEPTNRPAVASAARNGQIEGEGLSLRWSRSPS